VTVSRPFSSRLSARATKTSSRVCLGIDPRPGASAYTDPGRLGGDRGAVAAAVARYFTAILDASHDLIACCKPQSAFFEALGLPGLQALEEVIAHARSLGVPVILDAKRGDIGSTAGAYADAYLGDGPFAADALTVNPYLGLDTLEPFIERALANDRGVFVLVRTSNPGSADLQGLELASGGSLHAHLAARLAARAAALPRDGAGYTLLGAVVGASHGAELGALREAMPASWFLVPGYGAQSGTAASASPAFDAAGNGAVVSASRSLTYAPGLREKSDLEAIAAGVRRRVLTMRAELNAAATAG